MSEIDEVAPSRVVRLVLPAGLIPGRGVVSLGGGRTPLRGP